MPRSHKKREIYFSFSFPLLPEETSEMYHVINVSWMEGEVLFSCCGNNPAGGASQEGTGPDTSLGSSYDILYGRPALQRTHFMILPLKSSTQKRGG